MKSEMQRERIEDCLLTLLQYLTKQKQRFEQENIMFCNRIGFTAAPITDILVRSSDLQLHLYSNKLPFYFAMCRSFQRLNHSPDLIRNKKQ